VRSLRKILTQLRIADLCVNVVISASFALTFGSSETVWNAPKHESNWVDPVCSLRKILTRLYLASLCVNGTRSASFPSTFVQERKVRDTPIHKFWVQWSGSGALVMKNSNATSFSELWR
jgi:hypothetical protein